MTHPVWRCPGCNRPIEPIAAIRTYHAGCDPYARIEKMEQALQRCNEAATEAGNDERHTPAERTIARGLGAIIRREIATLKTEGREG